VLLFDEITPDDADLVLCQFSVLFFDGDVARHTVDKFSG
jgi:hypothetical protein